MDRQKIIRVTHQVDRNDSTVRRIVLNLEDGMRFCIHPDSDFDEMDILEGDYLTLSEDGDVVIEPGERVVH